MSLKAIRGKSFNVPDNLVVIKADSKAINKLSRKRKSKYNNKSIDNKYKPKVADTKTGQNKDAVLALSKQVKKLQFDQFGSDQIQMQNLALPTMYAPSSVHPIAFMANCFYAKDENGGTPMYYGSVNAQTKDPTITTVDQFEKATFSALDDLNPQYLWNEYNNKNQVSAIRYLPLSAVYKFRISSSILQTSLPHRYRITFLKIKNALLNSTARSNLTLPNNLGAYWHMCENDVENRNYFNSKYHKIIYDKFIIVQPPDGAATSAQVYVKKRTFSLKFPLKQMTPNFIATTEVPNQNMWTNTPIDDQIWCIISTSQGLNNGAQILITRHLKWKDAHGITT